MLKIHQFAIMCAPTTSQYAAVEAMKNLSSLLTISVSLKRSVSVSYTHLDVYKRQLQLWLHAFFVLRTNQKAADSIDPPENVHSAVPHSCLLYTSRCV